MDLPKALDFVLCHSIGPNLCSLWLGELNSTCILTNTSQPLIYHHLDACKNLKGLMEVIGTVISLMEALRFS